MEQRKNIYLIYKEAMNNAAKYSEASRVEVSLEKNKKYMHLRISDDGKGITAELQGRGNGLQNMRQRAADINGTFNHKHRCPNQRHLHRIGVYAGLNEDSSELL